MCLMEHIMIQNGVMQLTINKIVIMLINHIRTSYKYYEVLFLW